MLPRLLDSRLDLVLLAKLTLMAISGVVRDGNNERDATKPLPSPLWPRPSHYQAPVGHYQATTKPPLATTNFTKPLWPLPSNYLTGPPPSFFSY